MTPAALAAPVPALLTLSARPAPPAKTLLVMVRLLTPSNSRKSALAAQVDPDTVLLVNDEFVRLDAYIARPLPTNSLFEIVISVAGLVGSVEEKPIPCPSGD